MSPDASVWSERYRNANTPWDHGAAHPELERLLAEGRLAPPRPGARALVPGCGRGHDALALMDAGWEVTAIEFAPEAHAIVQAALAGKGGRALCADALAHAPLEPYDLLWEHTFFCALDPADRPRYAEFAQRVLRPGGLLAALVFPVGKGSETGGPPWGYDSSDLERELGAAFALRESGPARETIGERAWREDFALFERLP